MRARLSGRHAAARLLDPAVLARIDDLSLVARGVVDGFLQGLHRSPHLGQSLDFAEHRQYTPGDDVRRIDWRVYARTDRHYLRLFEAQTNADLVLLVDVSRSMAYGSRGYSKLDYATRLAAALAYFSARQRDRVGLILFDDRIVQRIAPSARRLDEVLHALAGARAERAGDLDGSLRGLAELLRRRGIVVLISDFYAEPERALGAVRRLRARGSDLIAFHVLDPAELEFPFSEVADFRDLETNETLPVAADTLRAAYVDAISAHTRELERLFRQDRIDYTLLPTGRPLDHALFAYLTARRRLVERARG